MTSVMWKLTDHCSQLKQEKLVLKVQGGRAHAILPPTRPPAVSAPGLRPLRALTPDSSPAPPQPSPGLRNQPAARTLG